MAVERNEETLAVADRLKVELAMRMYGAAPAEVRPMTEGREAGVAPSYLAVIPAGSNVLGFGYGVKWAGSSVESTGAVRVYVRTKRRRRDLSSRERIPEEIGGVPTDVIEIDEITAAFPRPIPSGLSGGHHATAGGTLGCLVTRSGSNSTFILSNNHVLANVNRPGPVPVSIVEPGPPAGSANPPIAHLSDHESIAFGGAPNEMDAAVAELDDPTAMTPDIRSIGRVNPVPIAPAVLMSVRKHGARTFDTVGVIEDIAADVPNIYPGVGTARFHGQIAVRRVGPVFARRGDSGALVVETLSLRPVGLLFAVGAPLTFCNPIDRVLARFHATIL